MLVIRGYLIYSTFLYNYNTMNILRSVLTILICSSIFMSCVDKKPVADAVFKNGTIYTVNDNNDVVTAVATKDGKILFAGDDLSVDEYVGETTNVIDLEGKTMTPGFVEGHGHFMGLGFQEMQLNLMKVQSYDELVAMVKEAVKNSEPGEWILGRGWHQSKWDNADEVFIKGFPTHDKLSEVSPDNPVYLEHASGHAAMANSKAMEVAGVLPLSTESLHEAEVEGGEIIRDELGNPTGIFNERAQELINEKVPELTEDVARKALEKAIEASWRNGITSFHDAGVGRAVIDLYQEYKDQGKLGVRMYVMLTGFDKELLEEWYAKGPQIDTVDQRLTIRSVKLNCDGALGSRGAWLLEEYSDRVGHYGMPTLPMDFVGETSKKGLAYGFQVCSHAIGDRANREILDRYEVAFNESPDVKDHRFRIEHAQHLHPDDIPRFGEMGVIPAMQAVHMSSDRPWAIDRLGEQRIVEGAYVWRSLMETGAVIVNGTDVPVEPVDPLASFYASVARKTLKGTPEGGYEPEQKMTREEALKSYTWNAAYGAFQEDVLGSIEIGKLADFTVFDKDIMTIPENDILTTEVAMTIVEGEVVYSN